jgi:hypothetical protein
MSDKERKLDYDGYAAKVEGLKQKMSPDEKFKINEEVANKSYKEVYERLTAVPEKVKHGKPTEGVTLDYGQKPKQSASIIEGKTFETLTPSTGVTIK